MRDELNNLMTQYAILITHDDIRITPAGAGRHYEISGTTTTFNESFASDTSLNPCLISENKTL